MSRYAIVRIEQLDADGEVWRTFERFPLLTEVEESLDDVRRGFNMDHTRVTVKRDDEWEAC